MEATLDQLEGSPRNGGAIILEAAEEEGRTGDMRLLPHSPSTEVVCPSSHLASTLLMGVVTVLCGGHGCGNGNV